MAPTVFLLLICGLLLASPSYARRKRSALKNPIDEIAAQAHFNPSQFAGKWYLVGVASRCPSLRDNSHTADGVNMVVSINSTTPQTSMWINTFYPWKGVCWLIKQVYHPTKTPGRFLLHGRSLPVDVVVGETDYNSYAIIFYQKSQQLSVKLYGRTAHVGDPIMDKFEQIVAYVGMNEDLTQYFRSYGFCHSVSQFHILDEVAAASSKGDHFSRKFSGTDKIRLRAGLKRWSQRSLSMGLKVSPDLDFRANKEGVKGN